MVICTAFRDYHVLRYAGITLSSLPYLPIRAVPAGTRRKDLCVGYVIDQADDWKGRDDPRRSTGVARLPGHIEPRYVGIVSGICRPDVKCNPVWLDPRCIC